MRRTPDQICGDPPVHVPGTDRTDGGGDCGDFHPPGSCTGSWGGEGQNGAVTATDGEEDCEGGGGGDSERSEGGKRGEEETDTGGGCSQAPPGGRTQVLPLTPITHTV